MRRVRHCGTLDSRPSPPSTATATTPVGGAATMVSPTPVVMEQLPQLRRVAAVLSTTASQPAIWPFGIIPGRPVIYSVCVVRSRRGPAAVCVYSIIVDGTSTYLRAMRAAVVLRVTRDTTYASVVIVRWCEYASYNNIMSLTVRPYACTSPSSI